MSLKCILFGHKWDGFQCERCNKNCDSLDFFTLEERELITQVVGYVQRQHKEYKDVMNTITYKITTNAVLDIQYVGLVRICIDLRLQEYMLVNEKLRSTDEERFQKLVNLQKKLSSAEDKYNKKVSTAPKVA